MTTMRFAELSAVFTCLTLALTGCAYQTTTLEINPVHGMSLEIPYPLAKRIRMGNSEISFLSKDAFNGFVEVVELPGDIPQGLPAIDALIQETAKGGAPTERLDLGPQAAGYAVHIDDFSTIWIVTRDNPSSLVVISIRSQDFNRVIDSLSF